MQCIDASRHHAPSAHRNGSHRLAAATGTQIIERTKRHHESAELPRSQRIRARAICARPFELHFVVPNATVIRRSVHCAARAVCAVLPLICHVEPSETSLTMGWRTVEAL